MLVCMECIEAGGARPVLDWFSERGVALRLTFLSRCEHCGQERTCYFLGRAFLSFPTEVPDAAVTGA